MKLQCMLSNCIGRYQPYRLLQTSVTKLIDIAINSATSFQEDLDKYVASAKSNNAKINDQTLLSTYGDIVEKILSKDHTAQNVIPVLDSMNNRTFRRI